MLREAPMQPLPKQDRGGEECKQDDGSKNIVHLGFPEGSGRQARRPDMAARRAPGRLGEGDGGRQKGLGAVGAGIGNRRAVDQKAASPSSPAGETASNET